MQVMIRAGELTVAEIDKLCDIIANPLKYKIPAWFLNRQNDADTGLTSQITSNQLSSSLRDDLERLKKIRAHRGIRHHFHLRVRGQHTKTSGRRGKVIGVSTKKN